MTATDAAFVHLYRPPAKPDAPTIVLLHGTGGNETSLLPVAEHISPEAGVLSPRGRSLDEGFPRWFRRMTTVTFDQAQIVSEAQAFADFMKGAIETNGLDPARMIYLGYSNGANMLGAVMLLHPGLIRTAVLLRAMNVLETIPTAELKGTSVLMTTGSQDPYGPYAPALERALVASGVTVENTLLTTGHDIGMQDVTLARDWLKTAGLSTVTA